MISKQDTTTHGRVNSGIIKYLFIAILFLSFTYCLLYFNYFETPSEDYIGNIKPVVDDYLAGNFPGKSFKLLPFYPVLLTLCTRLNPVRVFDPVYFTAILLNIGLIIPYLLITWMIFRKFLSRRAALAALLFLSVNIYTVFAAVNADLEMALSTLIVLTMYLALKGSKLSYIPAFFAAAAKWDSVFAVPAAMWGDFFYRKKRIMAIVFGSLAASGVAVWLLLSLTGAKTSNPYVNEIAKRGPNIYRYLIDCFLITSGFTQWMASQAYFARDWFVRIPLFAFLGVYSAIFVPALIGGMVLLVRRRWKDIAPIIVFFLGFVAIHMIYQNTKERYVIPVLWLLTLFLFFGLSGWVYPWIEKRLDGAGGAGRKIITITLMVFILCAYLVGLGMLLYSRVWLQLLFAAMFTLLCTAVVLYPGNGAGRYGKYLLILAGGAIINFSLFYGVTVMDHYSLRRVEFKKAGLWYKEHVTGGRMLITETNVAKYYTGFGDDVFFYAKNIESTTLEGLAKELKAKRVTYVFVDDFYIRRYDFGDKNAIDRKAYLFREIRDRGAASGYFVPVTSFETKGGIRSYIFRVKP